MQYYIQVAITRLWTAYLLPFCIKMSARGREAFQAQRSRRGTDCGALGSENVGMSNHNLGEIPRHRKFEVSLAMVFSQGLVGPKANPKGAADG